MKHEMCQYNRIEQDNAIQIIFKYNEWQQQKTIAEDIVKSQGNEKWKKKEGRKDGRKEGRKKRVENDGRCIDKQLETLCNSIVVPELLCRSGGGVFNG